MTRTHFDTWFAGQPHERVQVVLVFVTGVLTDFVLSQISFLLTSMVHALMSHVPTNNMEYGMISRKQPHASAPPHAANMYNAPGFSHDISRGPAGVPPPSFTVGTDRSAAGAGESSGLVGNRSQETLRAVVSRARKLRRDYAAYIPTVIRLLLVATFVEDGVRVLFELPHQIDFLRHEYRFPSFVASFLLISNVLISFVGVAFVLAQKKLARGACEVIGSYLLLSCVVYQQVMYGRHSPIASGNVGFLMRNLCLAGSLILIGCQTRIAAGQSALPLGLLDGRQPTRKQSVAYMQLASRFLLVLLALEFLTTLGVVGTIFTVPVVVAVLVGYQLEISGLVLLVLYLLHNVLNSAFWAVSGTYMREIMRYEFVQTLSIMGGLLLLINLGPGALSVDEMRGKKPF